MLGGGPSDEALLLDGLERRDVDLAEVLAPTSSRSDVLVGVGGPLGRAPETPATVDARPFGTGLYELTERGWFTVTN